ncbi:MAG: KOW motif-containing protein [Sphaerochaeta sp.]|jgi:transcription antitermination factor NusG|nr:KOW motif-containing protein [Sphaerochaeta sp.]MCH3919774.1 KOW motif-containing protein [Sphaerochaeta sp.]MCI2045434.1 KOW motif-containing protein [Sphaerochaeta sp.]MCI2076756.1 KOW motif-containing protein [Sphaerochaeta sp.]MCI2096663.1 KOW motif-containing protein [Sphaerochaeta sp.]
MEQATDFYYCIALPKAGIEIKIVKRLNRAFTMGNFEDIDFLSICPQKDVLLQHHGKWEKVKKPMIPGYLMVRTTAEPLFVQNLLYDGHCPGRLLRYGENGGYALYGRDLAYAQWVFSYGGTIGLSKVRLVPGSHVQVISGPLKAMQGVIEKVEKKGRKVWINITMMNQVVKVSIGAEFLQPDEPDNTPISY